MSHEIRTRDYPEKVDRKKVQTEWDHYAAMEDWQEGCSGVTPIRWIGSKICESYEEAEDEIKARDKGWYDCLAIRYKATAPVQISKTANNASDRVKEAQKAYNLLRIKVEAEYDPEQPDYEEEVA